MIFSLLRKKPPLSHARWFCELRDQGVVISRAGPGTPLSSELISAYLAQLIDDELATPLHEQRSVQLTWPAVYQALQSPGYDELTTVFRLPPFTSSRMVLQSHNALTDRDFSIAIARWASQTSLRESPQVVGAMLVRGEQAELMHPEQWALFCEVLAFARRTPDQRDDLFHRQAWGRIRHLALKADAKLDDFLHRSVVLTPERLHIELRKSTLADDDSVIEIQPTFPGAPPDWLERFDIAPNVPDRYDIVTPEGIVQVLITAQVKSVLQEVKRLPLRRVAGTRAQAFILNPYATLGPDAGAVIDEAQFEQARNQAGLRYERFVPIIQRSPEDYPARVGLLIESADAAGPVSSEAMWLTDDELGQFVARLDTALRKGHQLLGWHGYDLELQGETPTHLAELKSALAQRISPAAPIISYAQVYALSSYSSRIAGIGFEKPYYSPYIAKKKDDEGWFPKNVIPLITYIPDGATEPVMIAATPKLINALRDAVVNAQAHNHTTIEVPGLPKPIPVPEAQGILETFEAVRDSPSDPQKPELVGPKKNSPGKTLILRPNIESVDYEERRRTALLALPKAPEIPRSLSSEWSLLPHQQQGLAWLQHLYKARVQQEVRGAVLADDMGLGKTFQLLAFMAWLVEQDRNVPPMLVVAPVSLLENWCEEAHKFIRPGTLPLLMAYGNELTRLRVPRTAIDARLLNEDQLVRFLKPGWVGNAKVVLTTYETLRDLEFSFAAERWSVMVCDEAQRIKNPAAMVTRAAKKQNVGFKVACTGTPVENTLADLWCLFDFIQPGLLGALNDFGQRYRKPIEAKTDDERTQVEELRTRISAQILRRTKAEVAKDLPQKIVDGASRKLLLSTEQRNLYAKAIEDFKKRNDPDAAVPFKNHLGLLQYLRLICTNPQSYGLNASSPEPLAAYRNKSPKLHWLLDALKGIRQQSEKVIVFCEFRNIQRLLKHYIEQTFTIQVDIINGDTSAAAGHTASRQKRIQAFQQAPGFGVIILSPVAVGFGVNIQAANHVIHYTRTWNPAKEDQATDRAYRIGQKKDVYVYYPVVNAPDFCTFDVKLDQLLTRKRELASDMLNGSGDLSFEDFLITDVVPKRDVDYFKNPIDLESVLRLEWRYFEGLVAVLWSKQGFSPCYCTPSTKDQGVDVVAISGNVGVLIQAKTSSKKGIKLGWDVVKELAGGAAFYQRQHPAVIFHKVGITNQFFNSQAHDQANLNGIKLIEQPDLQKILQQYPVTMQEIDRVLHAD